MAIAQTTLTQNVNNANVTDIHVNDALGFAVATETDDLIQIDGEFLLVTGGLGTLNWTVTRGYLGSTATSHNNGSTVSRIERGYTNLARIKRQIELTDTDDDAILLDFITAANAEITNRLGYFAGPATDTVRIYDGLRSTDGLSLFVPGGIRTLSQVRTREEPTDSWVTAPLADFVLRPLEWDRRPGAPARWVKILDTATNGASYFNPNYETVELTGTFGWSAVPQELAKLADMLVVRMWDFRDAGPETGRLPTPSRFVFPDDAAMLEDYRREYQTGVA